MNITNTFDAKTIIRISNEVTYYKFMQRYR